MADPIHYVTIQFAKNCDSSCSAEGCGTAFLWPSAETSSFMLILYVCCYTLRSLPCVAGWVCVTLCLLCDCWSSVRWLVESWVLYFLLPSEASYSDERSFSCYFLYAALLFCCYGWSFINKCSFGCCFVTWRTVVLLLWLKLHRWM